MARIDPGPPPSRGLVVRPLDDGFFVRLSPAPAFNLAMAFAVMVGFGLVGFVIAQVMASAEGSHAPIIGGSILFGGLLYALSAGAAFFPAEVQGEAHSLSWAGERFSWEQIESCVADGSTLELRGHGGRILGTLEHLEPEAATWVAAAVNASLPEPPEPASTEPTPP
ncbi:MAG: hypothetical protein AAGA48_11710 [Myxococcota bacterium]